MKTIKTTEAVGHIICHDITQIILGERSGVLFKKGHIVKEEDIALLLSVGKEHLFVYEQSDDEIHENEAAQILYEACASEYMKPSEVHEGKIEIIATHRGLLKVDVDKLAKVNSLGEMIIATRHNNTVVNPGDKLAGTRIIPLVIKSEKLDPVRNTRGILQIKPFHHFKTAVITTGSEVAKGRIKDTFTPVIEQKLAAYGLTVDNHKIITDDLDQIKEAILEAKEQGAELIICTGGMSVDPDDRTPGAIKATGANILTYGTPVLPGAMLLVAYLDDIPVLGLPGCVMYAKATAFDLIFPRILAKDTITKQEIASLGHGGLCLKCLVCTYPHCEFGKG